MPSAAIATFRAGVRRLPLSKRSRIVVAIVSALALVIAASIVTQPRKNSVEDYYRRYVALKFAREPRPPRKVGDYLSPRRIVWLVSGRPSNEDLSREFQTCRGALVERGILKRASFPLNGTDTRRITPPLMKAARAAGLDFEPVHLEFPYSTLVIVTAQPEQMPVFEKIFEALDASPPIYLKD